LLCSIVYGCFINVFFLRCNNNSKFELGLGHQYVITQKFRRLTIKLPQYQQTFYEAATKLQEQEANHEANEHTIDEDNDKDDKDGVEEPDNAKVLVIKNEDRDLLPPCHVQNTNCNDITTMVRLKYNIENIGFGRYTSYVLLRQEAPMFHSGNFNGSKASSATKFCDCNFVFFKT